MDFTDPIPSGYIVSALKVKIFHEGNFTTFTALINGDTINQVGTFTFGFCGCEIDSLSSTGNGILPNYIYGGANTFQLAISGAYDCIDRAELTFDYVAAPPNDAAVASIDSLDLVCAGNQDIWATIANMGSDTLHSVTVNWEFDGVLQAPVNYNTPIDTFGSGNNTAPINLGNKNFSFNQTYNIKVWTSNPNGVQDTVNHNDTLLVTVGPGLAGTYTIGGASPDFSSFTEAVDALESRGLCDSVTFNVRNGTYNEQWRWLL